METKLYIGNLAFTTQEDSLRALLSQAGTVNSAELIKDRLTGESKGFAFIMMGSQADAAKATQMFNGYSLDGREIKVGPARSRDDSDRGNERNGSRPLMHKNRGGSRRY